MPFDTAGAHALEDTTLSLDEALQIIGGLSKPSKMPGWGWSIPAQNCQTGRKLAKVPGSICSICYAMKGNYVFPNVQQAMQRRLRASEDPRFVGAFIRALRLKIQNQRKPEDRFRWMDSGDLQSVEMLSKIVLIAYGTPEVRHYLPTKEARLVGQYLNNGGVIPANLFLKVSHPMIGQTFKRRPSDQDYSTVNAAGDPTLFNCPAHSQGNKCLDCDACWQPGNINYEAH